VPVKSWPRTVLHSEWSDHLERKITETLSHDKHKGVFKNFNRTLLALLRYYNSINAETSQKIKSIPRLDIEYFSFNIRYVYKLMGKTSMIVPKYFNENFFGI
jgi:hypothetical protein